MRGAAATIARYRYNGPAIPPRPAAASEFVALLLFAGLLTLSPLTHALPGAAHGNSRPSSDLVGTVPVREGGHVRIVTEFGNVVAHTGGVEALTYRAHLETDASPQEAAQLLKNFAISTRQTPDGVILKGQTLNRSIGGRVTVTLDLTIPKNSVLDVTTGGGNITTGDLSGHVSLTTAGGNITTGNIATSGDLPAHLETVGGHITVGNVTGDLFASTGGGHITAGAIGGDATLHTGGGHIRVASVKGIAHLDTGGGNVALEQSGADLYAETAGGQIEVGEAAGLVHAKTGGGGIHVVRVSGPTDLQTVGGSIYLTRVDSAVKASTGVGGITAWFVTPASTAAKRPGPCDLHSSDGDIVVYLPRDLPVTIDAQIELGDEHHVFFDPAFPLKTSYDMLPNGTRTLRAEGSINGGGEVLHLRTVAGNIRVILSDAKKQIEIYKQQMDHLAQQLQLNASQP